MRFSPDLTNPAAASAPVAAVRRAFHWGMFLLLLPVARAVPASPVCSRPLRLLTASLIVFGLAAALLVMPGVPAEASATPYGGTAVTVAASGTTTVQAANYDLGGEGVAYHDYQNGGQTAYRSDNIGVYGAGGFGWARPAEWEGYTINVAQAQTYTVTITCGCPGNGSTAHLEFGPVGQVGGTGVTRISEFTVPNVGADSVSGTATVTGVSLAAGTQWMRLVMDTAFNGSDMGNFGTIKFTPAASIAPTSLTATAGDAQVTLSWTASAGATSYNLYRGTSAGGEATTAYQTGLTGTSYTDSGLTNGTTYYYKVTAVNSSGESGKSNEASAVPQAPIASPTGLTATSVSSSEIDLSWTASTGATGYTVERSPDGSTGWGQVGTSTAVSFHDTGLAAGTTYYYRVRATAAGSSSNPSSGASAITIPAAPTGLVATVVSPTAINLTWAASTGAASYNLYRGTTPGGEGATPYKTGLTGTGYSDTGLTNGVTYYYQLTAVNASGESARSDEASSRTGTVVTPPPAAPPAPTGLVATAVSPSEIDLTWAASTGATGYVIERSLDGQTWSVAGSTTGTSFKDLNLAGGTTYYYEVIATDPTQSSPSNVASATTFLAAPVGLVAAAVSDSEIDLTWHASTGTAYYLILRSPDGSTWTQIGVSTTTAYQDTGLTAGTTYYYEVKAYSPAYTPAYTSAASNVASATTTPDAPDVLNATAGPGDSQITLSWTPAPGATGYALYRSTTPGGEGSTPYMRSLTGSSYLDTAVVDGTTYYYQITALNATGESEKSNEASATPSPYLLSSSVYSLRVVQGQSSTTTITVTPLGSFSDPVTISATGLPAGVTASFDTNPTTGSSVLTLTAASTADTGTSLVTITGTSGTMTSSTTLYVTVVPSNAVHKAYVTQTDPQSSTSDYLYVLNTSNRSVIHTINLPGVSQVTVTPDGRKAYVIGFNNPYVAVIDTATDLVTSLIPVNFLGNETLAVTPDGRKLYVVAEDYAVYPGGNAYTPVQGHIFVIDTATDTVLRQIYLPAATGSVPDAKRIRFSPDSHHAYVDFLGINPYGNGLMTEIDTTTDVVIQSQTQGGIGTYLYDFDITKDGKQLYLSVLSNSSPVQILDASTLGFVAGINDPRLYGSNLNTDFAPDGHHVYLSQQGSLNFFVIDTAVNNSVSSFPYPTGLYDYYAHTLAFNPDGTELYAALATDPPGPFTTGQVAVIDTTTNQTTATIPVGSKPSSISLAAANVTDGSNPTPLTLVADATVMDSQPAANFGLAPTLSVQGNTAGATNHTYLRFDLSQLPNPLTTVKLRLYGNHGGGSPPSAAGTDYVYGVADNTWAETGITWNNAPAVGQYLASASIGTTSQYYEWDVTAYVKSLVAAGNTMASFAVTAPQQLGEEVFNAKEAGVNMPQLVATSPATDFGLAASPAAIHMNQGDEVADTVIVTRFNQFSGAVTLEVTGLPSGVTAEFGANPTTGSSVLTLDAAPNAVAGNAELTITGVSGSVTHSVTVPLTVVVPPASFTLALAAKTLQIGQNSSRGDSVAVTSLSGFAGDVALAVTGAPVGMTVTCSPATVSLVSGASRNSTITVAVAAGFPLGTYNLTVTATSGSLTRSRPLTIVVTKSDFQISAQPATVTTFQGSRGSTQVLTVPIGNFTGNVSLDLTGSTLLGSASDPSKIAYSFRPATVALDGTDTATSVLTLAVGLGVPLTTYHLTVTGTSGGVTHTTPLTLIVNSLSVAADVAAPLWTADSVPADASDADGLGPSLSQDVSLPSGVEENSTGPDMWAYNPVGPGASYERMYRSALAAQGISSPGLPLGWVDGFEYDVLATTTGTWGPLKLRYPNGAIEVWTPDLDGGGNPLGTFHCTAGVPYYVTGVPFPTGPGTPPSNVGLWQSFTVVSKDHSKNVYTPDPAGAAGLYRLSALTNALGRSITINRDPATDLPQSVTNDASSPAALLQFGSSGGLLSWVQDPDGRRVTYSYGTLAGATPPVSTLTGVSQVNSTAPRWQYDYTALANVPFLSSVTAPDPSDPTGQRLVSSTTTYNANGTVGTHQDAAGRQRLYAYTGGSVQLQVFKPGVDPTLPGSLPDLQWQRNFTADSLHRDTGSTDAANFSDRLAYNDGINPYRPTTLTSRNNQVTQVTYDAYGNVLTAVDPRGVKTTSTLDYSQFKLGQVTSVATVGPASYPIAMTPTTFDYYSSGLVKDVYSPAPDFLGGASQSPPPTVTTSYTYTPLGDVSTVTGPGPNGSMTVTYNYGPSEALGDPVSVTVSGHASDGSVTTTSATYQYDTRGNVKAVIDALSNETDYAYSAADQVIRVTYPGGASTRTTYLYVGGPVTSVGSYDASGVLKKHVAYTYGTEGELLSVSGDTEPASYDYDGLYRLSHLTDGDGNSTAYSYDPVGNLSLVTYPGGDTERYTHYDHDGNLLTRIDGNGMETDYAYNDPESLPTQIHYPGGQMPDVFLSYDGFGRRQAMIDGTGSKTYSWDDLGDLMSTTASFIGGPQRQSIYYLHNPDGSRRVMTQPTFRDYIGSLNGFGYSYDGVGRLTGVALPWLPYSYSYDAAGRLHSVQAGGGSPYILNPSITSYTYDGRGFLTGLTNTFGNWGMHPYSLQSQYTSMTYDEVGNRLGETATVPTQSSYDDGTGQTQIYTVPDASRTVIYNYDTRSELTGEQSALQSGVTNDYYGLGYSLGASYDNAFNPTSISSTVPGINPIPHVPVNADNQRIDLGSYDGNGNPTTFKGVPFVYDPENRLTSIPGRFGAAYDGDGLRAWKADGSGRQTFFLYDGDEPVVEEDAAGDVIAANGFGPDGLRSRYYPQSQISVHYLYDPQGNLVQRVRVFPQSEGASGGYNYAQEVLDTTSFDAWGKQLADLYTSAPGTPAYADPVGFGGQWGYYTDPETGLALMTNRYYDAGARRFVTRDPSGYGGGINLYGFTGNNPVNEQDSSGLQEGNDEGGSAYGEWVDPEIVHEIGEEIQEENASPAAKAIELEELEHPNGFEARQIRTNLAQLLARRNPSLIKDPIDPARVMELFEAANERIAEVKAAQARARRTGRSAGRGDIQKNRDAGNAFRDEIAGLFEANGYVVDTEVSKDTPWGKRIIDIELSKDGKVLGGIEAKKGVSPYDWTQRMKDMWLKDKEGYIVTVVRDR